MGIKSINEILIYFLIQEMFANEIVFSLVCNCNFTKLFYLHVLNIFYTCSNAGTVFLFQKLMN